VTAGRSRATALSFQRVCEEPFRVFFSIGALLGIGSVSLWLLYYSGVAIPYPGVTRAQRSFGSPARSFGWCA
jgi:uncharacterized protein involved in response to NO